MSTSLFRNHFGTLPLGLTSLSRHDGGRTDATIPAKLINHAGTWLERIRALGTYRATLNELTLLSDRELADIGLNRSDIPRVLDPDFAAEHSER